MPSIRYAAVAASMLLCSSGAVQAAWPEHAITIIVPAAPGGTTDMTTRIIADKLATELGQSVVVENRAGAAGIIGSQQLVRAAPDGYTLIMGNIGPNAINYSMYNDLPYKASDFAPVTLVISVPNVLVVNEKLPVHNVSELIKLVRKDPDKATFGSSGTGQSPHLSGELFKQRADVQATHVPYKGAGPAVSALLAGQFNFMIDNLPSSMPYIQSGKFRALAVTSAERVPELPNVPTMKEAGINDMVVTAWFGLFAPAGTPAPIVDKLAGATQAVLAMPEVQKRFHAMGGQAGGNSPAEFGAFVDQERERWSATVKAADLGPKK